MRIATMPRRALNYVADHSKGFGAGSFAAIGAVAVAKNPRGAVDLAMKIGSHVMKFAHDHHGELQTGGWSLLTLGGLFLIAHSIVGGPRLYNSRLEEGFVGCAMTVVGGLNLLFSLSPQ